MLFVTLKDREGRVAAVVSVERIASIERLDDVSTLIALDARTYVYIDNAIEDVMEQLTQVGEPKE